MGGKNSKNSDHRFRESVLPPNQQKNYDDEVVNRLRKDLNNNPEVFLLNNILMSIQFYENFEREMVDLRKNQVSEREIEINRALGDHQKHCLLPDTVMQCINDRVRFRPFHGPKKFESQPLVPQRMFIVHDNIEVLYEGETSEYSIVDGPLHRAVMERAEKQGYVQLKQVEFLHAKGQNPDDSDTDNPSTSPNPLTPSSISPNVLSSAPSSPTPMTPRTKARIFSKKRNSPSISSPSVLKEQQFSFVETDTKRLSDARKTSLKNKLWRSQSFSLQNTKNLNISGKPQESMSAENINKDVESENEEYGYTTLRRLTQSKPLSEARANRSTLDLSSLSSYCITEIKVRKIIYNEDESDSDDSIMENGRRKPPVKKKRQDFYDIKRYFNSVEFSKHFGDVFSQVYPLLEFSPQAIQTAMFQGGIIHCEGYDKNHNKIFYEIIPTVATSWPELALEWDLRRRPTRVDPTTNIIYQWPTNKMIKKIRSLQSNVLPIGYLAKRGENKNNSLEWSLAFPAAERYMETCMSHSQVRCYLFILALYKTFMEPANTKLGLAPHHIRTLIFWEIEKNFITWPEERLGSKILIILQHLYTHLSKGYLPDYFVRERNLLESTPSKYLRVSQSNLHAIIERPVVHFLLAMRNLRYTSGTFFPTLNFKSLYHIITISDSLALINPALSVMIENNTEPNKPEEINEFKDNAIPFWNKVRKTEDRERKWKRELRKQIESEKKEQQQNLIKARRTSADSLNLEITVPKLDSNRRRVLLEFFIIHFMAVANKCLEYEAYSYAIVILNHSLSLAMLLGEEPSGEVEARPWKLKIRDQRETCVREIQNARHRPPTVRDSSQFAGFNMVLDNHKLNMKNLQKEFNGNVATEQAKKKKKRPANLRFSADLHTPSTSVKKQNSIILHEDDELNDSTEL